MVLLGGDPERSEPLHDLPMKKLFLGLFAAVVGISTVIYAALHVPAVTDTLVARAIERQLREQRHALFEPDALRVLFCGTSSPFPDLKRAKSCIAIFAAGRFWVVDAGPGSWNNLGVLGVDASLIGAVLLTHFHSDHIGDLGELNLQTWAGGRPTSLKVYGPPGVERVVSGFTEAYALDTLYRTLHHGTSLMPPETSAMEPVVIEEPRFGEGPETVLEVDGLRITAFPVRHDPVRPAYGYRFDYLGRAVMVSGDTAETPTIVDAARGADVLVHEAQANHIISAVGEAASKMGRERVAQLMNDIPSYHTSPVQAARLANEAGVRMLVLTHLSPPPPNRIVESIFVRGVDEERTGDWLLATDRMLITLPVGSEVIEVSEL